EQVAAALRAAMAAEAARRAEERRRREAERHEQIAASLREVLAVLNSSQQATKILNFIAWQAAGLFSSDATAIYTTDTTSTLDHASDRWTRGMTPVSLMPQATSGLSLRQLAVEGARHAT